MGIEITNFDAPDDEEARAVATETAMHVLEPVLEHWRSGVTTERAAADTLVARPPLRSLVEDLHERREQARLGGGEERIARQHEQDKLTARERLALLIDEGTFTELGIHGRPHFSQRAMEGKEAPADGVVTGYGRVDGRLVAVAAYDFTVMAGSMGMTGEMKVARLRELALTKRIPMLWLLDSAGARIQEAAGLAVRGVRPPVPRGGHDERRGAAGGRADGPVRGRAPRTSPGSPTSCRWSRAAARWRSPGRTSRRP